MPVPTVYRAVSAVKFNLVAWSFFTAVVTAMFSLEPDIVTDLTAKLALVCANVGIVFTNAVFPNVPVDLIPLFDTFAWICRVVASHFSIASKIMYFLEMSTYAFVIGLPKLPLIGSVVSSTQVDSMTQRYDNLINVSLTQSDVLLTAGCILLMISIIVQIMSLGTSQQKTIIKTVPKHMETYCKIIWVVFECVVGSCTTLTQENVENVFGSDSFFTFQVVVLVANHIFCYRETKCMDLKNGAFLQSIPGCLSSTGTNGPSLGDLKKLRPKLEKFIQKEDYKAWNEPVGDINVNEGPPEQIKFHKEIEPAKNILQTEFDSPIQAAGDKQYVFALNCVPDPVVFTILYIGIAYVAVSDLANLRNDAPLLTYTAWKFVAEMRSDARGNGPSPAVFPSVVGHTMNQMCPITVDQKNVSTLKDADNKENTTQRPPEANTTDEMPSDEVPDGSVQDSDNTVMVAVGGAVTSGLGYVIYWFMTQG